MTDEERAGNWFREVTKPHLDIYNDTMRTIAPYRGSPRYERERKAAKFIYEQCANEAAKVYARAMHDLETDDEISQASWDAMERFEVGQTMLQAAE